MISAFNDDYGVEVLHAWGMTEMSPLGTVCTLKNKHSPMDAADKMKVRLKQGRAVFGVDMKIVDPDGTELPWDGKTSGDLLVKGPWIIDQYFKQEGGSPLVAGGWFPTGDVGTIDEDVDTVFFVHHCSKPLGLGGNVEGHFREVNGVDILVMPAQIEMGNEVECREPLAPGPGGGGGKPPAIAPHHFMNDKLAR